MCDGRPSDNSRQRGPGDAHSAREWIWRRRDYERLFDHAPSGALRFESTPFYLWDGDAHERIAAAIPDVELVAVIRDPIDRAFSNWTHLWADGLEPFGDFPTACAEEQRRVDAGWAPFWRYLELGRYGEQLEHLFRFVPRERVYVLRYRQLIEQPADTLDGICRFLGVRTGELTSLPESNVGRWAVHGRLNRALRAVVRAGAVVGSWLPPNHWRRAQRPLLATLQRHRAPRPHVTEEQRGRLVGAFAEDNALLGRLLGVDYSDWMSLTGRGTYTVRRS